MIRQYSTLDTLHSFSSVTLFSPSLTGLLVRKVQVRSQVLVLVLALADADEYVQLRAALMQRSRDIRCVLDRSHGT